MARWTLSTLDGSETYVFEISPNAHTSMLPDRSVTWAWTSEGFTGRRAGRTPHPWEFSGVLRTQEQFDHLRDWVAKREKVHLTTDLDQTLLVRLMSFKPSQQAATRNRLAPWRHTYTVSVLTFDAPPDEGAV